MNKEEKVLIINAIKTDNGYYIIEDGLNDYSSSNIYNYLFDGENPKSTYLKNWYLIDFALEKIEKMVNQPNINYRYELIDKKLSGTFPELLTREEFCYWGKGSFDSDHWVIKDEWRDKKSLYKEISDKQDPKPESMKFKFNIILEIDNIKEYAGLSYSVPKTRWEKDGKINITDKNIEHQTIDKIVFPEPVLTSKPSKFSSEDSYKIIREYVKQHINMKVAEITSDYDFCFTVKKRIKIKNNLITKTKDEYRVINIFEMTHSPNNYKGYTPIKGFVGKNHEDLKKNIDTYLNNLIEVINEPLIECSNCRGTGVINIKKIKTNPEKKVTRAELIDI